MSIFDGRDETPLSSGFSFSGFTLSGVNTGEAVAFIHLMSFKIYERIFRSALDSLAMTKEQSKLIMPSASSSYTPRSDGFIKYMATAASRRQNLKIYGTKKSNGTWLFNSTKPEGVEDITEFQLDFSAFDESKMIASACGLMFQVLNAAAKGIKASEAVLVKLENLTEQIADQKTKKALRGMLTEFEKSLREGKLIFLSGSSTAEFMSFDTKPSVENMAFCYSLISMITGYPLEFFNGVGGSSLSDTGASTEKAIERADAHYSESVINPFIQELFGLRLEAWPKFESISDLASVITFIETTTILTNEDKKKILMSQGLSGEGVENAVYTKPRETGDFNS